MVNKDNKLKVDMLKKQLQLLKEEYALKESHGFNFAKINPDYEYEWSKTWLEHVRKSSLLGLEETMLQINIAIDKMEKQD